MNSLRPSLHYKACEQRHRGCPHDDSSTFDWRQALVEEYNPYHGKHQGTHYRINGTSGCQLHVAHKHQPGTGKKDRQGNAREEEAAQEGILLQARGLEQAVCTGPRQAHEQCHHHTYLGSGHAPPFGEIVGFCSVQRIQPVNQGTKFVETGPFPVRRLQWRVTQAPLLTDLIQAAQSGDSVALRQVFDAAYADLSTLARQRLRIHGRGTLLDTVSLVNDAFLRLADAGQLRFEDRQHFLGYASQVMRSVVIDYVRGRLAQRRGGDAVMVTLNTQIGARPEDGADEILRVNEAVEELAALDPRLAQVVVMRYFAGMTDAEIGEALDLNPRTVRRDWEKARLLLLDALR